MRRTLPISILSSLLMASLCVIPPVLAASSKPGAAKKPPAKSTVFKVPGGDPRTLYIPKINVTAPVESLALNRPQDTHAPYKWTDVAWYSRGAKPGSKGHAAIFGHVDSVCCPAVFYRLNALKTGDIVEVRYKTGPDLKFRVMWTAVYPNNKLPLKFLFGRASERGMSLITCTGIFHGSEAGYDHKRVVFSRLILPNGKLG